MSPTDTFLKTKVHAPALRKALVSRPRLVQRLVEALNGPLTLVTAPAGFGKTTLAVTALTGCGMPVAWLGLDRSDNSIERFLSYCILALQTVRSSIGQAALEMLAAVQPPSETVLAGLINDLVAFGQDLVLVLDDYQAITNPAVHSALTFWVDHCPANFHLVITTRSDPPIPLARLRAGGQVGEVRASDLRFTPAEASQFLNDCMGLQLDGPAVQALEERTEGWIAGLQMAALSMRDREDPAAFIASFSGSNRYILDYLLEEVLAGQPPEVQRFLLFTSILDRLCGPLCEEVIGDRSTSRPESSQLETSQPVNRSLINSSNPSILAYLESSNLFLISLDDERRWYRYHHLFADLLQTRLAHLYPDLKPELHRRAAAWLEKEGSPVEAINQALAGGAHDQAARLVEENTALLLAQGEMKALMSWVDVLPEDLRRTRPWLCVHQAYALAFAGRVPGVEPLLQQAEAAAFQGISPEAASGLEGAVTAVRAMAAVMVGRDAEAVGLAKQALARLPEGFAWHRSTADWALGFAERSRGNLPAAGAAFAEMVALARAMGNVWTLVSGLMDLANVARAQGDLHQARALYEEAFREANRQGVRGLGYIARMESGLASVLYEQNQLQAADRLLADAVGHIHQWPNPNHLVLAFAVQARLRLAQNDFTGARAAIEEAGQIRQREALTLITNAIVETGLVRIWLGLRHSPYRPEDQTGAGDELGRTCAGLAERWRESLNAPAADAAAALAANYADLDESSASCALMLARLQLSQGQPGDARLLAERAARMAKRTGNVPIRIEALIIAAVTYPSGSEKDESPALACLEEALALGEPGGFVRIFVDEDLLEAGRPVQALLRLWFAQAGAHPLRAYALQLLNALGAPTAPAEAPARPAQPLVEPLSQRELEVLGLIAEGLTNQEIAQKLIISAGTVKAHTAAIYRKLDVTHRTEAVSRARQLHILP